MPLQTNRGYSVTATPVTLAVALGNVDPFPGGSVVIKNTGSNSIYLLGSGETVAGGKGFDIVSSGVLAIDLKTLAGAYLACAAGQTSTVTILRERGVA